MSAGATRLKICRRFPRSRYDSEHLVFVGTRYKYVRSTNYQIKGLYICVILRLSDTPRFRARALRLVPVTVTPDLE